MGTYTEKSKKYTIEYIKKNLEEIRFRVRKGEKEKIRAHAESMGEKLTPFLIRAVRETMERDMQKKNEQSKQ